MIKKEFSERIKDVLIQALDNPNDTFSLTDDFYIEYEESGNYFTGEFYIMDNKDNYLKSYDLSTYWNTQSEILTMGNKILEDIAQEILDYINELISD